ncbi:DUF6442 family protein [Candidatus Enterococcus leclercqii]|uniref:DUF6442 family protein n=1 Tax=Candidatus Enterococcus leclercqii TaxID=1857218 RepID=UPI00137AE6C5|nr:DUF6442 family protein [Enterococcus sp. CU9D]KAF1294195.1 hypothetical protein BAU14_07340 [Enterococcus sp. CU9D]
MKKSQILAAAQKAQDDEGRRTFIKNSQSLVFAMYSLGIIFLLVIKLARQQSINELLLLILLGGLGIEIEGFLKKHSLINALFAALLFIATGYIAWLIVKGK